MFSLLKIISVRVFETRVSGYPLAMRFVLNCFIAVRKADLEELERRSLSASPLMKPAIMCIELGQVIVN